MSPTRGPVPERPTMKRRLPPLTLPVDYGTVNITPQQWCDYISPVLEDQRGELETRGPWSVPVRYSAPAVTVTWASTPYAAMETITLWGRRTMSDPRESGYVLEGRASLGGAKRTCFTSSQMFRLPDGRLLETATIHCRKPEAQ
jgi:hypothetical protein